PPAPRQAQPEKQRHHGRRAQTPRHAPTAQGEGHRHGQEHGAGEAPVVGVHEGPHEGRAREVRHPGHPPDRAGVRRPMQQGHGDEAHPRAHQHAVEAGHALGVPRRHGHTRG
ncbi:hypothetical protein RZS08_51795, partial [Arthrospira platensis SPKY1]|nr:hypothetical protein [Arthrospira platensis SPKY1]